MKLTHFLFAGVFLIIVLLLIFTFINTIVIKKMIKESNTAEESITVFSAVAPNSVHTTKTDSENKLMDRIDVYVESIDITDSILTVDIIFNDRADSENLCILNHHTVDTNGSHTKYEADAGVSEVENISFCKFKIVFPGIEDIPENALIKLYSFTIAKEKEHKKETVQGVLEVQIDLCSYISNSGNSGNTPL